MGGAMERLRLLGILCICVIALVSASTNANDPLASGLLNAVFIISCGVIGVWLLRKTITKTLRVRQRGSRRIYLPVEFPLEDSQRVIVIQDRRSFPDRRKEKYGLDSLKGIPTKMASN
jgi:hypothetical protein